MCGRTSILGVYPKLAGIFTTVWRRSRSAMPQQPRGTVGRQVSGAAPVALPW